TRRRSWAARLALLLTGSLAWSMIGGASRSVASPRTVISPRETAERSAPQSPSRKRPVARPKATPTPTPPPSMRPQAAEVAEQIARLSRFVFLYGKIVNGLEVAEEQARLEKPSPEVAASTNRTREALVQKIAELDEGVSSLMGRFQADLQLQVQYLRLAKAGDALKEASQLASAGQFHEAGISLTVAIERLTDTIMTMKLP
ncbi:MAG: hypothetical protein ACOYNR_12945, partial [Blastocatellia bacterium]